MSDFENLETDKKQCPEIRFFGAKYPDAICIDGYLWDMDSWDDEVGYTSGGEEPCPTCNSASAIQTMLDNGLSKEHAEDIIKQLTK